MIKCLLSSTATMYKKYALYSFMSHLKMSPTAAVGSTVSELKIKHEIPLFDEK